MQLMKPLYGRRSDLAALLFLESTVPSVSAIMDRSATIDEAVRGTGSLRVFAPAMSFSTSRRPFQRFGCQPESAANRISVAARIDQTEDGPQKSGNLGNAGYKHLGKEGTMGKLYMMQRSNNLTAIARRFGLNIWQDLYNSTDNAAFCAKRLNPNLILPSDIVVVPD